jgi:hypothetical protein
MAKMNFTIPAKDRPLLPRRIMKYRGELNATVDFNFLSGEVHRECNKILFRTDLAYQKACAELGIEPKPREGVIELNGTRVT